MRIMKKSLAMLLALTMVLSLVAINVVAGDENTVKVEQNLEAVLRSTTVDQDVEVEIYIETDATGICGFKATVACPGLTLKTLTAPEEGRVATMGPVYNEATGNMLLASASNKVLDEGTLLATAVFTVPANTAVGEYPITVTLSDADIVKVGNVPVAFTATGSTITVTEKKFIKATEAVAAGSVEYGATAPVLPAKVKGLGKTSSEAEITAVDNIELDVVWDTISTLQVPGAKTVNGTVAEPVSETIEFKNDDYTADVESLTAVANYTITKSTAGVVAPVEIEIKKKSDGSAIGLEAIKVLEEVVAVANTTIAIEGGETETVTLNWAGATLYDDGDATLDTSLDAEESIQLNVPVTGDTTYYDLTSEVAVATLTMVPAEIEDAAVTIEGATTADDYVKVKASLPVEALATAPTGENYIYGAGYEAVYSDAKAKIDAMTIAMGRDTSNAANVDNKTMYVGLDNLEIGAKYGVKVFKGEEEVTFGEGNVMEFTNESKNEVVFYWTFNTENPDGATEDVVDAGVYTIKAYKDDAEFDSIDVTVGEAEVLGVEPVDYAGTFTLAIDAGAEVLEDTHTYSKDYIVGTDVDVTVEDGVATLELIADTKLSAISGINTAVDAPFTVSVYYNNAALVVDVVEEVNILGVTGKIMAVGDNTTVGGIGIPTTPAKPMTPVTPDEPGTEEPGTEEPGTEEPGTDAPAIDTPIEGAPFGDITEEYRWAVDSIATLKDLGVINGNENGDFVPAGEITRAEFTKMMVVLLGLEITEEAPAFADCAADAWFAPYIAAAAKAGIINGVSETEFAPDATITREQACAILGRALGLTDAEVEAAFTDAGEISDYAESFVAALAKLGIINGYEDGSFAPANNITRAEAAKILAGALGVIAPTDAPAAE